MTTIIDHSKVIANFMGLEMIEANDITATTDINKYCYNPRYHSSWNWLMPVWRKVIDVIGLELSCGSTDNNRLWLEKSKEIEIAIITVDIQDAFTKITRLINWYNNWQLIKSIEQ